MTKHKRRIKLIKAGLQLRLTLIFVGLVSLALLLQFLVFMQAVTSTANTLPNDGAILLELADSLLLRVLALSFLVFLPLTYVVGVLTTFRIAGPIYRFEKFFRQVLNGERPQGFKLRKGDELQDLAHLINSMAEFLEDGGQFEDADDAQETHAGSEEEVRGDAPRKSA